MTMEEEGRRTKRGELEEGEERIYYVYNAKTETKDLVGD